jgi:hypothetical protein
MNILILYLKTWRQYYERGVTRNVAEDLWGAAVQIKDHVEFDPTKPGSIAYWTMIANNISSIPPLQYLPENICWPRKSLMGLTTTDFQLLRQYVSVFSGELDVAVTYSSKGIKLIPGAYAKDESERPIYIWDDESKTPNNTTPVLYPFWKHTLTSLCVRLLDDDDDDDDDDSDQNVEEEDEEEIEIENEDIEAETVDNEIIDASTRYDFSNERGHHSQHKHHQQNTTMDNVNVLDTLVGRHVERLYLRSTGQIWTVRSCFLQLKDVWLYDDAGGYPFDLVYHNPQIHTLFVNGSQQTLNYLVNDLQRCTDVERQEPRTMHLCLRQLHLSANFNGRTQQTAHKTIPVLPHIPSLTNIEIYADKEATDTFQNCLESFLRQNPQITTFGTNIFGDKHLRKNRSILWEGKRGMMNRDLSFGKNLRFLNVEVECTLYHPFPGLLEACSTFANLKSIGLYFPYCFTPTTVYVSPAQPGGGSCRNSGTSERQANGKETVYPKVVMRSMRNSEWRKRFRLFIPYRQPKVVFTHAPTEEQWSRYRVELPYTSCTDTLFHIAGVDIP